VTDEPRQATQDETATQAEAKAHAEAETHAEIDEAILAQVSDYLDGALTGAARTEVATRIAGDPIWRRAHAELLETRSYLSGMRKAHAPSSFTESVAETIHQRSAGRFFGKKTLGDRVPFGALLAIALVVLVAIGYVLWSSSTGSLRVEHQRDRPAATGSAPVAPP
jgi:anti-sigma factor RsiW